MITHEQEISLEERISTHHHAIDTLLTSLQTALIGQSYLCQRLLMGLLTHGHILVEGVPGLAKTTAIKALSCALDASFSRVQFTPDLLPADVTGTQVYHPNDHTFHVKKGPIFANLVLADEINRAPAKTQSSLLEAMQEQQITIGDQTHALPNPFLVMATQNPVEQEGTYPLPEAEVDRFIMKVQVNYPTEEEEVQIIQLMEGNNHQWPKPCLSLQQIKDMQATMNDIHMEERLYQYIVHLVWCSRDPKKYGLADLQPLIHYGASPRASIFFAKAARANAFLKGRSYITPQDIKDVGMDILRHRIIISYEAEAQNITSEHIIQQLFDTIPVP